jgi:hypothetical protein
MSGFAIPVVLFIFKRVEATLRVVERIAQIRPEKLYLISDWGRDETENVLVTNCRRAVEDRIDWKCTVIKNYAVENRGIYDRIGLGAQWVFAKEPAAIFLEDDNLPELSFFEYCRQLLERYHDDSRVFWICGTNYLGRYRPEDGSSYMFTKHLLPCGWASWACKFLQYYDADLDLFKDPQLVRRVKYEYLDRRLYGQQIESVRQEQERSRRGERYLSWDYHLAYSLRVNNLYGIAPQNNLIKNIGVDCFAEHGGSSFANMMTWRFCGMDSHPLEFPLTHPRSVLTDRTFEKKVGRLILYPLVARFKKQLGKVVKRLFGIAPHVSLTNAIKRLREAARK